MDYPAWGTLLREYVRRLQDGDARRVGRDGPAAPLPRVRGALEVPHDARAGRRTAGSTGGVMPDGSCAGVLASFLEALPPFEAAVATPHLNAFVVGAVSPPRGRDGGGSGRGGGNDGASGTRPRLPDERSSLCGAPDSARPARPAPTGRR